MKRRFDGLSKIRNIQEIRNWTENLLRDIKAFRDQVEEVVQKPETTTVDAIFEAFNDVEHDFEKLQEQIEEIGAEDDIQAMADADARGRKEAGQ